MPSSSGDNQLIFGDSRMKFLRTYRHPTPSHPKGERANHACHWDEKHELGPIFLEVTSPIDLIYGHLTESFLSMFSFDSFDLI
jgi:hypothetical protein